MNEEPKEEEINISKLFKADHCQKCGTKFVKYPLKGQPEKTLGENYKEGTILWKNLFPVWETIKIIWIVLSIYLITFGYKHDIAKCNEIIQDPYHYCVKAGCTPNPMMEINIPNYSNPNASLTQLNKNLIGGENG